VTSIYVVYFISECFASSVPSLEENYLSDWVSDMEQVLKSVPSYLTRRRKIRANIAAFFENSVPPVETNVSQDCTADDHHYEHSNCFSPWSYSDTTVYIHASNMTTGISDCDDTYSSLFDDDSCISFSDSDDDDTTVINGEAATDGCNDEFCLGALWATQFDIRNVAVNALLQISCAFHSDLPHDSRNLLSTPRHTVTKKLPNVGKYDHYGLKRGIEELASTNDFASVDSHLKLQFNVDGLPLFESSGMCIWPIMCMILESSCKERFVVGVFCGMSKPSDLNEFLADFIDESKQLIVLYDYLQKLRKSKNLNSLNKFNHALLTTISDRTVKSFKIPHLIKSYRFPKYIYILYRNVECHFVDFCQTIFPNCLPHMLWVALRDFQVTHLSFIGGEDEKGTTCRAMGAVIGNDCDKL
jgi:hypothetical protein